MREDRWITLYDEDKNPALKIRLTEDGYEKYKAGEKWDHRWVDFVMDINLIKLAEF